MQSNDTNKIQAPPGAPAWVTPELLVDTLETWQPYYSEQLTVADGLAILMTVSRLVDAVQQCQHSPTGCL